MTLSILPSFGPGELVAAALDLPLFSLVLAAALVCVALTLRTLRTRQDGSTPGAGARPRTVPARYRPERRALGLGAILVIVVFATENVVRGYLLNLVDVVEWWQYATPVFSAVVCGTAVMVLIAVRGSRGSEVPVGPTERRTWATFSSRAGLIGAGTATLALLGTTIAAGLASSADDRGRYIYLELPVPNTPVEALHPWFYGWSYGLPVLACLAALVAVTWAALRGNALRPFLRPETAIDERLARTDIAFGLAGIGTAGALLALGGACRFIGRYGSMSQVTVQADGGTETYDMIWQYGGFALAAGRLAPLLEVIAFALLLVVARRLLPGNSTSRLSDGVPEAAAETAR